MSKRAIVNIAVVIILTAFVFNAGTIGLWTFIGVVSYIACRLVIYVIKSLHGYVKNKGLSKRESMLKMTACFMGIFFITGTILYIITFPIIAKDHDVKINNAELIIRSMICSLDMFMLDVDSNILDRMDSHPIRKGFLITQAAASFICTITLLVSLVFSRAKAYYRLHRGTKISIDKNHLYLFFGVNDNSRLLSTDIRQKDKGSIILFIDEANVKEDENDSWDNIVSLFAHRQKTFDLADDSNALVAIASKQLCDIDDDKLKSDNLDILNMVGLGKIRDLIRSLINFPGKSQLHIFFLSDNEDNNIRGLINLAKDITIRNIASDKEIEHKIYCHARYNGPNRVVEDLALRKQMNVEIIDSSHIAVELLKSKPADQPVRVAHLSEHYPTMVDKPLDCLIVGFGEVGRDAFRFLYEFGTFMQMKDGYPMEANPKITVIDSKMDELSGLFMANTPALGFDKHKGPLALKKLDYRNQYFYTKCLSERQCNTLNYIVLALGDDDQNIALASNIFNRIRRYRNEMTHLIIMVRCIKEEKYELMQKVAAHYNRGSGVKHDIIRLFGNPKEIYSYNTIICDDLTNKGKTFFSNYVRLQKGDNDWKSRHEKLAAVEILKNGEVGYPNIDSLRKLRRQESQDMANALHAATKMWLLQKSLGKNFDWNGFLRRYFDYNGASTMRGAQEDIYYPRLSSEENMIIHNLAMLEHARWNAAHILLGYQNNSSDNHGCDEKTQHHNCLKSWQALDSESDATGYDYKAYDFCVIDTTIAISKEDLKTIHKNDD